MKTLYASKKARLILAEALNILDQDIPSPHNFFESILQLQQNSSDAIAKYTRALSLEPDDTYCLATRGEFLLRVGRFDEAAADLLRAIETDPLGRHPAANRARLLITIAKDILQES